MGVVISEGPAGLISGAGIAAMGVVSIGYFFILAQWGADRQVLESIGNPL